MELFRRRNSNSWQYDFTVRGKRFRGSTNETTKTRAAAKAALIMSRAMEGNDPLPRKAPLLQDFSARFLEWLETTGLEQKTKTYYQTGMAAAEHDSTVKNEAQLHYGGRRFRSPVFLPPRQTLTVLFELCDGCCIRLKNGSSFSGHQNSNL